MESLVLEHAFPISLPDTYSALTSSIQNKCLSLVICLHSSPIYFCSLASASVHRNCRHKVIIHALNITKSLTSDTGLFILSHPSLASESPLSWVSPYFSGLLIYSFTYYVFTECLLCARILGNEEKDTCSSLHVA